MASSAKLVLRGQKKKANGEVPIYLRITVDGSSSFIASGVSVPSSLWNGVKGEIRATHPIADSLNFKIKELHLRAQQEMSPGRSANEIKQALQGSAGDFNRYVEAFIIQLRQSDRFWEERKFQTTLRKCQACWGADIPWKNVTRENLQKLELFLIQQQGNSVNTTRKELARVRRLVMKAIRDDVISASSDPFVKYRLPKENRVERRKLELEEIQLLQDVPLESFSAVARDAFLFSFYGAGIRFGDLCVLKVSDVRGGRLRYKTSKTNKPISVLIPAKAEDIIARYSEGKGDTQFVFPFLKLNDGVSERILKARISSRNAQVNTYLKRIAKKAGLDSEGLSMHVARHSYADYARRSSGNIHAIMQALGHSDIRVTQTYLKSFDSDAVDEMTRTMWE